MNYGLAIAKGLPGNLTGNPITLMSNVLLETVVPGLGAIVSLLMYGAPISAVLRASAKGSLGVRRALLTPYLFDAQIFPDLICMPCRI